MTPQELRDWRKSLKITQEQAAQALGVTERGYFKWENGDSPITHRVDLAAQMYLRKHRTEHGFHGLPLLYVVRLYENPDAKPLEHYLVIARNELEAGELVSQQVGRLLVNVRSEAVAEAPTDLQPGVIGTIGQIAHQRLFKKAG